MRIGNWVNVRQYPYENEPYQISSLSIDNTFTFKFKGDIKGCFATSIINPIPLTEEWLLKFGFEKSEVENPFYGYEFFLKGLSIYLKDGTIRFYHQHSNRTWVEYESVHELQNLYFALTVEELSLSE